jgi:hypothetical protein
MDPNKPADRLDPVQAYRRRFVRRVWAIVGALAFLLFVVIYWGIFPEVPTDYADIKDHFKYGSIGSDGEQGIPYWIWRVLPDMFPDHLPEPDRFRSLPAAEQTHQAAYAQFGFLIEAGRDLPIGFSKRRVVVDRVGLNCAVCHVGTVRVTPGMEPAKIYGHEPDYLAPATKERALVLGMPAHTVDLTRYVQFLLACGTDNRFTPEGVLAAIERRTSLGPIDRLVLRQAVPKVRDALEFRKKALAFVEKNPRAGPGRVDTFNPYKYQFFAFPQDDSIGTADFPSLWNQRPREGMQLHWDGNNTSVFERNLSAAMGAGATPVTVDIPRILRVANWIGSPDPHRGLTVEEIEQARLDPVPRAGELPIPKYPFPIDEGLAERGQALYRQYCADCHDWRGKAIGQVDPIDRIGTDPYRLNSFTAEFAFNQNTFGSGQWWRFRHFRKTNGYVNMPLDGIWARAPYLHNGSVPTLHDLLNKSADRPKQFWRGDDEYDPAKVGFRSDRERSADGRALFQFDTALKGNGKQGHEGRPYGTDLPAAEKKALLEYLKKL